MTGSGSYRNKRFLMGSTDGELDAQSLELLGKVEDVRDLERRKRRSARSTPEFHRLAEEVERASRDVFSAARDELEMADADSPIPAERAESEPGDWSGQSEK